MNFTLFTHQEQTVTYMASNIFKKGILIHSLIHIEGRSSLLNKHEDKLDEEKDDLNSAENWESSEKSHRAADHAQRRLKCHLSVQLLGKLVLKST